MLDAVGLPVRRLIRVRVGPLRLGRLRAGELRDLDPAEVRALYRAAGL
jgi:23S rRNA pseudouridine2605 synthase